MKYIEIKTACDRKEIADKIVKTLVENKLVACCQVYDIESTYWWNEKIENTKEYLIQMKTKASLFDEVKQMILSIHDYNVCEVIATEIVDGNEPYLNWIEDVTK